MKKEKGFTLIELLAVIVLIAIIMVIAVPKILNVIENSEKNAYKKSVEIMAHQALLQYNIDAFDSSNELTDDGIVYEYGVDGQTNIEEVGELKFKGDKPSAGTITLTKNQRVIVSDLVSKNGKWCAQKEKDSKTVTVGKSEKMGCKVNTIEEKIVDKVPCELEEETKGDVTYYYVDSESDLYRLSDDVNNGTDYKGKIIKLRNNLDMSKSVEEIKKSCDGKVKTEITKFYPIGRASNKSFSGTFEGNTKTISNLTIDMTNETNSSDKDYVGLFGYSKGTIKGFTLDNVDIKGGRFIGGITGYLYDGKISEVIVKGTIEGDKFIGGIMGYKDYSGKVSSVIVNVNVSGTDYISPVSDYGTNVDGVIIEGGNTSGALNNSNNGKNFYYVDGVTAKDYSYATKIDKTGLSSLNAYESAIDTYIGGDDDDSGYYFDYNDKNELVIKSVEKDPIVFNLKGTGTESDPYLIGSYNDWKMATIKADQANVYFKLTKDIDFTGKHFYMLGSIKNKFTGTLDGDGHKLSGITSVGGSYQGIIGYMDGEQALVKNLTVKNANFDKITSNSGTITGYLNGGTIEEINVNNSNVICFTTTDTSYAYNGGIVGYTKSGNIKAINTNNINVSGGIYVGGITGHLNEGIISEVITKGTIEGEKFIGGIMGYKGYSGKVSSVIVNVNVSGTNYISPVSDYGTNVDGVIIEGGNTSGALNNSNNGKNFYYVDGVTAKDYSYATKIDKTGLSSLNAYESAIDTYIGGDDDDSGYYFDYNDKNELVIKSVEKDPIVFNLKGTGTESDPYLIGSYNDWKMATIKADQANVYFKLTKDIDFTGKHFYMLGSIKNKFTGTLDGDGHKLSGITSVGGSYQGIIGYMDGEQALVKNLTVKNANFDKITSNSGTITGYLNGGTIEEINVNNSNVICFTTTDTSYAYNGGIVGYTKSGNIKAINTNNINVSGGIYVGGITGHLNEGIISEVITKGTIEGEKFIGGIMGYKGYSGKVSSVIVNVNVSGTNYISPVSDYGTNVDGVIIEGGNTSGALNNSNNGKNFYYVDGVTAEDYSYATKIDKQYLHNLSYYSQLKDSSGNPIIETEATGDVNGTGYVFGYDSNNNIIIERKN